MTVQPGKEERVRRLRAIGDRLASLEVEAHALRSERDRLALELVQVYELTWRETAEFAGFANPYIAKILRDQRASGPESERSA